MDEKLKRFLSNTELFASVGGPALDELASAATTQRYSSGSVVFEQGTEASALFFVRSGGIEVRRRDSLTGVDFLLAAYGPGKSVGEEGVFSDAPHPITASAVGETQLVRVGRDVIRAVATREASVAAAAAGILARRTIRFVAEKGVRFISLHRLEVDPEVVAMLPARLSTEHSAVPIAKKGSSLTVAMVNPHDPMANDAIRRAVPGLNIEPVGVTEAEFERFVKLHRGAIVEGREVETSVLPPLPKRQYGLRYIHEGQDNIAEQERRSDVIGEQVIQLLDTILGDALFLDASDIHVEPDQTEITIRYRIDGKLMRRGEPIPMRFHSAIINRVKALASMDITERRKPQDGRLGLSLGSREVSLRISTVPTRFGENMVMRVLDRSSSLMSLDRIVLVPSTRDLIRKLIFEHHGIVFVTGPTGSGKTTTMYSAILERQDEGLKIVTVEDPIEYTIPGITQVQYNESIGLTYAEAVRSFLRQDTDVMLIGETRDARTAQNAIQAALSGHLVLSSIHTNSALGTVYRLQEMGIEPFLIANAVVGVVAQRLVRTICTECREPYDHNPVLVERLFGGSAPSQLYHGAGCTRCNGTGFRGRTAVMEALDVNEELRTGIATRAPMSELRRIAMDSGMVPFRNYAKHLLVRGLTTPQEILQSLAVDDEGWAQGGKMKHCLGCGSANSAENAFCEECGTPLS